MEFENKAKDAENRGDFLSAIQFYLQALKSVEEMPLLDGLQYEKARILHSIGTLQTETGNYAEAIKQLSNASNLYLESDEALTKVYRLAGECQTAIGASQLVEGNYKIALDHFRKAVGLTEKATKLEEPVLRRYVVERTLFNHALVALCLIEMEKDARTILDIASLLNQKFNITGFASQLILFLQNILAEKFSEARMVLKDELEEAAGATLLSSALQAAVMGLIEDLASKHIPKARLEVKGEIIEEKGKVILSTRLYEDMLLHGLSFANNQMASDKYKEVYSLVIGQLKREDVIITEIVPIASGTDVEVEFQDEHYAKAAMIDAMAADRNQNEFIVGWFHTHPAIGLFLSPTDILNQLGYQSVNPKAIAIVFDFTHITPKHPGYAIFRLDDPSLGDLSPYHEVTWQIADASKTLYAKSISFFENFLITINEIIFEHHQIQLSRLAELLGRSELVLSEIVPQLIEMRYLPAIRFDSNSKIISIE